jgi:hypothetical protein
MTSGFLALRDSWTYLSCGLDAGGERTFANINGKGHLCSLPVLAEMKIAHRSTPETGVSPFLTMWVLTSNYVLKPDCNRLRSWFIRRKIMSLMSEG